MRYQLFGSLRVLDEDGSRSTSPHTTATPPEAGRQPIPPHERHRDQPASGRFPGNDAAGERSFRDGASGPRGSAFMPPQVTPLALTSAASS